MKLTNIKLLLVLFLILSLVSVIYCQATQFSNPQHHQAILDKLQKIDTNSVELNEQVFKVQQGILRNYDGLIATVDTMKQQAEKLKQYPPDLEKQEIVRLVQVLAKLGEATEQFLSINAVLNNSLAYLPVLVNEFSSDTGVQRDQAELGHQLLEQLFVYNRWHQLEHKKRIEKSIETVSASSITEGQGKAAYLKTIVLHAQVIYKNTEQLNQASNAIFSADVRAVISTIRQQYMNYYSEQREHAEYLNWMVYFITFVLLLVVFNFIVATARDSGGGSRKTSDG